MNPKKLFQKYYGKLNREGIVKATLCGSVSGLAALFISGMLCWFFGYNGFWVLILAFVAAALPVVLLTYYKKFRPTTRSIAKRVDELGLEERLITMTELEGDPSYIAMRQREDAMKSLSTVSEDLLKIAVSVPLLVSVIVAGVCGLGGTTVYALYSTGVMKSGVEMIQDANAVPPQIYTVEYVVEGEGEILGMTEQEVYEGEDALAVMAVPKTGYIFIGWSDGYDGAYRVDYQVGKNISVTAMFEEAVDVDPDNDDDNNPEPDDLPPYNQDGDPSDSNRDPTDKPSDDGSGEWTESDNYMDGGTDYGQDLGDATDGAQGDIGNAGDGDMIGGYFDGIQK